MAEAPIGLGVLGAHAQVPFARTEVVPEAVHAAVRVLTSGWVTTGPITATFEERLAATVGAAHGVAVSSCTAAIELSLMALDLPPGSGVLTSSLTFCGAVEAIVRAGLRPVLADVDPHTLMPDADTTAQACERDGGVAAMVVVHYAGQPAPVRDMAAAAGLPMSRVVEDAAHALGTWAEGRPVGAGANATCFSFYATKNLPIGEGGLVSTDDPDLADLLRRSRLHGMSRDAWRRYLPGSSAAYDVDVPGLKANLTDLQAAIGIAQLEAFPRWQARRAEIAGSYDAALADVPGISLPARPMDGSGVHAWHLYVVQVDAAAAGVDRDELARGLAERGVGTSVHFVPVHQFSRYRQLLGAQAAGGMPNADAVGARILSLPLHPGLADEDVDAVCAAITDVLRTGRRRHRASDVPRTPADPITVPSQAQEVSA